MSSEGLSTGIRVGSSCWTPGLSKSQGNSQSLKVIFNPSLSWRYAGCSKGTAQVIDFNWFYWVVFHFRSHQALVRGRPFSLMRLHPIVIHGLIRVNGDEQLRRHLGRNWRSRVYLFWHLRKGITVNGYVSSWEIKLWLRLEIGLEKQIGAIKKDLEIYLSPCF